VDVLGHVLQETPQIPNNSSTQAMPQTAAAAAAAGSSVILYTQLGELTIDHARPVVNNFQRLTIFDAQNFN